MAKILNPVLDPEILKLVRIEVEATYDKKEMKEFKTFGDFFDRVDTDQTYEEEWRPTKYRPYYKQVWDEIKGVTSDKEIKSKKATIVRGNKRASKT